MRTLPTRDGRPRNSVRASSILSSSRPRRRAGFALAAAGLALLLGATVPAGAQGTGPGPTESAPGVADPVGSTPAAGAASVVEPPNVAPPGADDPAGQVSVVTLTGLIDPILADLMRNSVADAERIGAKGIVFQTDLEGSVIPEADLVALVRRIGTSSVPAHVWIGPSGSRLTGGAAWLLLGARHVAMAPGTTVGDAKALSVPAGDLAGLPGSGRREAIANGSYGADSARSAGIADIDAPTLGAMYVQLPGVQVRTFKQGDQTKNEPITQAVFSQTSLLAGFLHTASSPAVAYLMLTIGLSLLIFELFTAGVGVAGFIGAGAFVLGCYGFASLPTRPWAVALLVGAMLALAVDVQTGVPRFWTGLGLVLYTIASFTLVDGYMLSWPTIVVGIGGVALAFLAGMPSMVRTRFSTPTIGREWMIGSMGRAITDISPDGVVQIDGAPWRAYTNRATPIEQLDMVRVIGIEGLVLEVEPEEGAARDYRDRRTAGEKLAAAQADAAAGSADHDPA